MNQFLNEIRRIFQPKTGQDVSAAVRVSWFLLQPLLLRCRVNPFSFTRVAALRLYGARVGQGVTIRPGVRVKFPWKLTVGDRCSIGEDAWIDNMEQVVLGDRAVVSQGAYLCTGNHDWRQPDRPLTAQPITVEADAWVGARANIGPGITIGRGSLVSLGTTVTRDLAPETIAYASWQEKKILKK